MLASEGRAMLAVTALMILCGCFTVTHSQPVVTSPSVLTAAGGVDVVEGSVLQIYCTVEADTTVTFSWTLNGATLSNDPAHIRIRQDNLPQRSAALTGSDSTTVLTVDKVTSSDDGLYQCTATESGVNGTAIMVTVAPSSPSGTLMVTDQPSLHEPLSETVPNSAVNDNRTGVAVGASIPDGQGTATPLLTCTAGHVGDDVMNYTAPTVEWIRDGQIVNADSRITITTQAATANGRLTSSLTITDFAASDAGQYQCVFTDGSSDGGEVVTSIPHQLDTGPSIRTERVSPEVIILRPPNKLVIEVRVTGDYDLLAWSKGTASFIDGSEFPENYPNYFEVYVKDNTTAADEGFYSCIPQIKSGTTQLGYTVLPSVDGLDFAVSAPVDATTTSLSSSPVTVTEGGSVEISCRSEGAPLPTISWELNNITTGFLQTDVNTDVMGVLTGTPGGMNRDVQLTPGNVESTLHIVSASYPEHNGVYSCIGDNGEDDVTGSATATVTVVVHVIPEVELVASRTLIPLNTQVTLTCSVTRGNPMIYTYSITESSGALVSDMDTHTFTITDMNQFGNYSCQVTNDAGTGVASVTIELGQAPVARPVQPLPVVLGFDVTLECVVTGDRPYSITWERINPNGDVVVFTGNDSTGADYTIMTVTAGDYGEYRCSATSEFGNDSATIPLEQATPPTLPDDQVVEFEIGTTLTLSVTITDFNLPLNSVEWLLNGLPISSGPSSLGTVVISDPELATPPPSTATLTIDSVLRPAELEMFSVTATNPAGAATTVFNVTVTAPAMITLSPVDLTVSEGNETVLVCTARGFPVPDITWYSNGVMIMSSSATLVTPTSTADGDTGFTNTTSTLTIADTSRFDAGFYSCSAENSVVGVTRTDTQNFTLAVNFPPEVTTGPQPTSLFSPDTLNLTCSVDGFPIPTITWSRDTITRDENGTEMVVTSELMSNDNINITVEEAATNVTSTLIFMMTEFADTGNYSCSASNGFGVVVSDPAQVTVYVGANVSTPMNGATFTVDETMMFSLTCSATGLPAPTITFTRDGLVLDPQFMAAPAITDSLNNGLYQTSVVLSLASAGDSDSGEVTCMASNTVAEISQTRQDSVTVELVVNVAPNITIPPVDTTVVSTDNASLTCTADGVPQPAITWFYNNELPFLPVGDSVISTVNVSERVLTSTLSFPTTEPNLSGTYTCVASNILSPAMNVGSPYSASAELTVNDIPRFITPPENFTLTVNETEDAVFECSASGVPAPNITWFMNVTELVDGLDNVTIAPLVTNDSYQLPGGRGTASLVSSTLTLGSSQDSDSGQFSCVADNGARGPVTRDFELVVQVAPSITRPPMDSAILEGMDALFTCQAIGRPRPSITWYRAGENNTLTLLEISDTGASLSEDNSEERVLISNLTIHSVAPSDAGTYTCIAENIVNSDMASATLTVYVAPNITSVYPTPDQTEYRVNATDTVTFECTATGIPAPDIQFNFMDNMDIEYNVSVGNLSTAVRVVRMSDGELVYQTTLTAVLDNAVDDQSGIYECIASNGYGDDDRVPFELIVQVAPTLNVAPETLTVIQGSDAVFVCEADGVPIPRITWLYLDPVANTTTTIMVDSDYTIDLVGQANLRSVTSTLTVLDTEVADFGGYICVATNIVGSTEVTDMVPVLTVNVPVMIVSLEPASLTVNQTNTASFTCNTTGIPLPGILWRGSDGNPVLDANGTLVDSRLSISSSNVTVLGALEISVSTLTIDNTQLADDGVYTCEAFNTLMNFTMFTVSMDQGTASLTVQVPPEVVSMEVNNRIVAVVDQTITLDFTINNAVPLVQMENIRWFYSRDSTVTDLSSPSVEDITDLTSRPRFSFTNGRLTLTIMMLDQGTPGDVTIATDTGRYFLLATNEAGSDFAFIDVIVEGPPLIIDPPMNISVINGNPAIFPCDALAFPEHTVSWQFTDYTGNTTDLVNGSDYIINGNSGTATFGQLTVLAVEYDDRGEYTCTAVNSRGNDTASGTLTVHVTPIIEETSGLTEAMLGSPVVLVCLATGFPLPDITWQKGGEDVNIYSDTSLNARVDIIQFVAESMENNTTNSTEGNGYQSSGFTGSGTVEGLLMMYTNFTVEQIQQLGELGVVGLLSFEETIREDSGQYTCTASNSLPMTGPLTATSDNITVFILEQPDPPVNVAVTSTQARAVDLQWTPGFNGNRPITRFDIYIQMVDSSGDFTLKLSVNSTTNPALFNTDLPVMMMIDGLSPFTNYSFTVVACNEIGCSNQSQPSPVARTEQAASSPPVIIMLSPEMTTITVTFSEPATPNGVITNYTVTYSGSRLFDPDFSDSGVISVAVTEPRPSSPFTITVPGLSPNTLYSVTLLAVNGAGDGEEFTDSITTANSPPVPPPVGIVPEVIELPQQEAISNDPRTVTFSVIPFDESNGPISQYQIIVVRLPEEDFDISSLGHPDTEFPDAELPTFGDINCDLVPASPVAYITAEMSAAQYTGLPGDLFVVGLNMDNNPNSPNNQPDLYSNGPLCYSTSYTFFVRAFASDEAQNRAKRQANSLFVSSSYIPSASVIDAAPAPVAAIAAVIIILLLAVVVVLVVVVLVLVWRRRRTYEYKTRDVTDNGNNVESLRLTEYRPPDEGSAARQPIPLSLLPDHTERMHLNENAGFVEEYKIIQDNSPKNSVEICTTAENKPKNRYANIQCFDETRVVLTPIEGAEHDYINANFIEGYNRPREYIAAQGPLPDTCGDFWRMVWDYESPTIVMLTNLVEKMKIKCSQYWPNTGTQQYSNIKVTLVNTVNQSDFIIRHFQIRKIDSDVVKDVRQYHFVSWPDFGVPRHATPLLHFIKRVRNLHRYSNDKPLVIHCSAGVGRTGTLITIDVELQRASKQGVVDPFNYVTQLRKQRNHLVQTEAQYAFLHDAILEGVTCGSTELKVEALTRAFDSLSEADQEGETGFHREFNRLRQFKVDVKEFTDANDDANKFKNRIYNALPYNYNRVHLQMSPGVGGSDYINASYVDGYANKGQYIATQGPLANTVDDFWRMVWEKEVYVIVMLTQLEEKGKEQCAVYWPDSLNSPEKMGSLSIETLSEKPFEDYILREIKLADFTSTEGKNRVVRQYHFNAWPADGAPSSGAGMIDLIDQVTRTQAHTGNKPIVVHCSAGVGRTGAFCALSTSIERVKIEGVVDVFHCVKHLRTQRPHMVQSAEQYAFCYVAIREYVESLSSYSNFQ